MMCRHLQKNTTVFDPDSGWMLVRPAAGDGPMTS